MKTPTEVPNQGRLFEITLDVSLTGKGEVPAPRPLPPGVSGYWNEICASVKTEVKAKSAAEAVAAAEALVPELAAAPGVTISVHAPTEAERAGNERALKVFLDAAARATPEQRAWAERAVARINAQTAEIEPELRERRRQLRAAAQS